MKWRLLDTLFHSGQRGIVPNRQHIHTIHERLTESLLWFSRVSSLSCLLWKVTLYNTGNGFGSIHTVCCCWWNSLWWVQGVQHPWIAKPIQTKTNIHLTECPIFHHWNVQFRDEQLRQCREEDMNKLLQQFSPLYKSQCTSQLKTAAVWLGTQPAQSSVGKPMLKIKAYISSQSQKKKKRHLDQSYIRGGWQS